MKYLFIIFILVLAFVSCRKDDQRPTVDNLLKFEVMTIDTNLNERDVFEEGEDVGFKVSLTNISKDTVQYFEGLKCAVMKFSIYSEENLIGYPHPENMMCEDDLPLFRLAPQESISNHIFWSERISNSILQSGEYSVRFETKLGLAATNYFPIVIDWRNFEFESDFTVN